VKLEQRAAPVVSVTGFDRFDDPGEPAAVNSSEAQYGIAEHRQFVCRLEIATRPKLLERVMIGAGDPFPAKSCRHSIEAIVDLGGIGCVERVLARDKVVDGHENPEAQRSKIWG
jgi:hypothetical protein